MKQDRIEVEILADGTIKITTDKVSAANHANAAQLMREIAELAGGPVTSHRKGSKIQEVQHQQKASN